MTNNTPILKHLEKQMIKDWYGNVSGFSLALEAWRRGLTVTIDDRICSSYTIALPKNFNEYDTTKSLYFKRTRLVNNLTEKADQICRNKDFTKELLGKENITVPLGKRFKKDIMDDGIIEYAKSLGFPVVLKPTKGAKGKGVIINIQNDQSLKINLEYVRQTLLYNDVIIEEYVTGNEYRLLVVGDQVIGAIRRIPANIIGNGVNTVDELIKEKNTLRRKNPCTSGSLINIDNQVMRYVHEAGYNFTTVLPEGKRVFLRETSNVSVGGDPVDATDEISEAVKANAVSAVKSIPGLYHAGVDVLIDLGKGENDPGVIIEINSRPMISLHLFPILGTPRDVPSALIDFYFPETLGYKIKRQNDYLYFNQNILAPALNGLAAAITLKPIPTDNLEVKEIIIEGLVQGIGFRRWIQSLAVKSNQLGYVENMDTGDVRIVVAGLKIEQNKFLKICKTGPKNARIDKFSIRNSKESLFLGFQIL